MTNISNMACMHTQRGINYNPYYIPTKIDMVTKSDGGMQMATLFLWHGVLYAAVIHTTSMTTWGKNIHR